MATTKTSVLSKSTLIEGGFFCANVEEGAGGLVY